VEERQQKQLSDRAANALSGAPAAEAAQLETAGGAYVGAGRRRSQDIKIENNVNVTAPTNTPAAVGNATAAAVGAATSNSLRGADIGMPTVEATQ
jgi:hypothetical protein